MKKILVCYFSATGKTKEVALKVAEIADCEAFEIEPVLKYTQEDLDWNDKNSRSTKEMEDKLSRPEIVNRVDNIDNYNTIILGFPVWWYTAPTIINTFIEQNNLKNKDIYVFVTSGSSSYESSFNDLKATYKDLNFVSGIRLTGLESVDDIVKWIK